MKRWGGFGLRYRLVLLVLLGGIPSFGLILYTAADQRRVAAEQVQEDALRMARLASATQERLVEGVRQVLVMLSRLPDVRGTDRDACNALLAELLGPYPLYANFGVIERDGTVFASGLHLPRDGRIDLSDRAYFLRALAAGDFAMGDFQVGRITRIATVNFGYPVRDTDGNIYRVVFAALDLDWLEQLAEESELPRAATLLVVDQHGTVLVHYPDSARWRGASILDVPDLERMISGREGTFRAAGLDGLVRLFAFTPLRGTEGGGVVSVGVGIPEQQAFAAANRMLKRNALLLGLVAALVLAAAWAGSDLFVLRQVRALLNVIGEMREGRLGARTGVRAGAGELDQLANAFDHMAESLEQRIGERQRAEDALRTLNIELEQRVNERTRELDERNRIMQDDLDLAREFQTALLPEEHVLIPSRAAARLRFCHQYQASGGVGGDFYEIIQLSGPRAGLLVCDVMGHGIRAALVTAIIRGLAEELRPDAPRPGRFMTGLHRALADIFRQMDTTMFAASFYAVMDPEAGQIRYTNAGNPTPLILRAERGEVETLAVEQAAVGPALGLVEAVSYSDGVCRMQAGDMLLLYTDGLYEVTSPGGEEYGEDRLKAAVRRRMGQPLDTLIHDLIEEIRRFAADRQFEDDVCIIGVEMLAES